MGRQIITTKLAAMPKIQASSQEDPWATKVLKLIPADIIAVYLCVYNLIKAQMPGDQNTSAQWVVFILIALIMPFYLRKVAKITSWKQILLTGIAFLIWVLSIGGPFESYKWDNLSAQFIGALLLPIYTLIIPIFYD